LKFALHHSRFRAVTWGLLSAVTLAVSGCASVAYYAQSVSGQMDLWWHKEPLDTVLARPDIPAELRDKLTRAKDIRQYASQTLHLPENDSYRYYIDLGRPYVVWNIFAAPEFSIEPKKWCYPVVGCASYRGYFAEGNAKKYASELEQEGLDVFVGGVPAYSTLGWFTDPLLNTMMRWSESRLAGLIFHELTHQVIYIKSDAEFNEALATAVEQIGTLRWLKEHHPDKLELHLLRIERQREFRDLLLATRTRLTQLYGSPLNQEAMRAEKKRVFSEMRAQYEQLKKHWNGDDGFDSWFDQLINNARLALAATYLERVPAFYALFLEQDRDWPKFYAAVRKMGEITAEERANLVEDLLSKHVALEQTLPN